MQITIIETEIKTAIRNHILGLISVREDMKIDIDLRATRGQEGFTAIVDILPEDPSGKKTQTEEAAPVASTAVTKAEATTSSLKASARPKAAEAEEEKADAVEAEATEATEAKPQVIAFGKKAKAVAEAEAKVEETAAVPAKSIFAALGRPVNTPATAVNE